MRREMEGIIRLRREENGRNRVEKRRKKKLNVRIKVGKIVKRMEGIRLERE